MLEWLSAKTSFFNSVKSEAVKDAPKKSEWNYTSYISQGVSWVGSMFYCGGSAISLSGLTPEVKKLLFKVISLSVIAQTHANDVINMTDPTGNTAYQYAVNSNELAQYDGGQEDIDALLQVPIACGALLVKLFNGTLNSIYNSTVNNLYDNDGYGVTVDAAQFYGIANATVQFLNETITFLVGPENTEFETCMKEGMDAVDDYPPINWKLLLEVFGGIFGSIALLACGCCLGCYINRKCEDRQYYKNLAKSELNPKDMKGYGTGTEAAAFHMGTNTEVVGIYNKASTPICCC